MENRTRRTRRYLPTVTPTEQRASFGMFDNQTSRANNATEALRDLGINEYKAFTAAIVDEQSSIDGNGLLVSTDRVVKSPKKNIICTRKPGKEWDLLDMVSKAKTTINESGEIVGRSGWRLPDVPNIARALNDLPGTLVRSRAANGGDSVFFQFEMKDYLIGRVDLVQTILNIFISQREGTSSHAFFSGFRPYCLNAIYAIKARSEVGFTLPHSSDASVEEMLEFVVQLRARLGEPEERIIQFLEALTRRRVGAEEIELIVNAAIPMPTAPKDVTFGNAEGVTEVIAAMRADGEHSSILDKMTKTERTHAQALARMSIEREGILAELNAYALDGQPFADTAYGVYMGVTAYASHRTTGRGNVGDSLISGMRRNEIERAAAACELLLN